MARNDGKYLEEEVQDYYKSLQTTDIHLHRFNDSAAARNLTKAQPADFLVCREELKFLLECKSIKHEFRLPKFVQHSRMVKWGLASMKGFVLIHHWQNGTYRIVDVSELDLGAPSHDLRPIKTITYEEAMKEIFNR